MLNSSQCEGDQYRSVTLGHLSTHSLWEVGGCGQAPEDLWLTTPPPQDTQGHFPSPHQCLFMCMTLPAWEEGSSKKKIPQRDMLAVYLPIPPTPPPPRSHPTLEGTCRPLFWWGQRGPLKGSPHCPNIDRHIRERVSSPSLFLGTHCIQDIRVHYTASGTFCAFSKWGGDRAGAQGKGRLTSCQVERKLNFFPSPFFCLSHHPSPTTYFFISLQLQFQTFRVLLVLVLNLLGSIYATSKNLFSK